MDNKVNFRQGQVLEIAPKFWFPNPQQIEEVKAEQKEQLLNQIRQVITQNLLDHLTTDKPVYIKFAGGIGYVLPQIVDELRESGYDAGMKTIENKASRNTEYEIDIRYGGKKLVRN